jgi:hypothetical protein
VSQTVFILGAGASAQAGAPLMNTFIPVAQDIKRGGTLYPKEQENFDLVFSRMPKPLENIMAEREGFEPSVQVLARTTV